MFSRNSNNENKYSRVLTYINIRLTRLYFPLRKDIINCKDINLVSFFNNSSIYFLINVYSDNHQSTSKYLKDTKVNLNNILIIIGNFNIRNNNWNSSYPCYSNHTDFLNKIANSLNLELSTSVNQILITLKIQIQYLISYFSIPMLRNLTIILITQLLRII